MAASTRTVLPNYDNSEYTSCYCEENIYWLVKRFQSPSGGEQRWDIFSVFISNPTRTVALWNQRMGSSKDTPIIWDYHVVLALRERSQVHSQLPGDYPNNEQGKVWIYDLDTHLPIPCHWKEYVDQTFRLGVGIPSQYQEIDRVTFPLISVANHYFSLFRVIPGDVYLDNFASDRSHMLDVSLSNVSGQPRYLSEPPPYPAICGPEAEKNGIRNNLMTHFVAMNGAERGFGTVMDFDAFTTWCSPSHIRCD